MLVEFWGQGVAKAAQMQFHCAFSMAPSDLERGSRVAQPALVVSFRAGRTVMIPLQTNSRRRKPSPIKRGTTHNDHNKSGVSK
jgi:hypothetical protein